MGEIAFKPDNWIDDQYRIMEVIDGFEEGTHILRFPPNYSLSEMYSLRLRKNSGTVFNADGREVVMLYKENGRWVAFDTVTEISREHFSPFYAVAKVISCL